ncbi:MAG: DUF2298 domain-containing protein [Pelolinea sp.]|nr:DUF2298 domain-containing protein [Pelolinea sp.]
MIDLIKWFLSLEILGWVIFPLSYSLFKGLADKGLSISKILGLLLWGYLYWLGNTFQILKNDLFGVVFAFSLLVVISIIVIRKNSVESIINWLKTNLRIIFFYEILFLITCIGWAVVRAANPEIIGTEKPMELAFITSIYRSPSFPPNDPWLSNYAISYYNFGYLLVSMMMRLCGTVSGVAFNLAISTWFAFVTVSSSGILFNLLFFRKEQPKDKKIISRLLLISLLAPLMILIVSNGEGFLEVIHSKGIFWTLESNNQMVSSVWKWIDIKELTDPPPMPLDWLPGRAGGTWWWRASRVLQDYTLNGHSREIINEFPFFSFLLADLHPHVLAMPFVLLVIYFSFSKFLSRDSNEIDNSRLIRYFKKPQSWITGLILGVLIFVNTWDFPIYFGFIILIHFILMIREYGINKKVLKEIFLYSISLGIISMILYIPFLLGLSSQAGGFLPSMIFRTRGIHFLIMFLPQMLLISWLLFHTSKDCFSLKRFSLIFIIGIFLSLLLLLFSFFNALLPNLMANIYGFIANLTGREMQSRLINIQNATGSLLGIFGADSVSHLIQETIRRLLASPVVVMFMILLTTLCFIGNFRRENDDVNRNEEQKSIAPIQFIQILIILGALLCFFPEFFYLRDQFGWRMNTIFKFYFQAWIIFSFASAYAIAEICFKTKTVLGKVISISIITIFVGTGLLYPFFAIPDKTNSFQNFEWSLDGNKYFEISNPLEYEAISFLENAPYGIVAEAVGGSYSGYGRISKFTGFPTVLGWPGHESQWRGGANEIGNRESDIKELYITSNWDYAKNILEKYKIRYVFLGLIEKNTYPVSEKKFNENLTIVFNNAEVSIFKYSPKSQ